MKTSCLCKDQYIYTICSNEFNFTIDLQSKSNIGWWWTKSSIFLSQDITEAQKQLNLKLVQYEKNQEDIETLQNEVKKLESNILERKAQLADSEKELREVNMQIFMKVPNSLEGKFRLLNRQ